MDVRSFTCGQLHAMCHQMSSVQFCGLDETSQKCAACASRTPNAWSTPHKKLENCELLKSSAAAFMKSKDFRRACKVYLVLGGLALHLHCFRMF